MLSPHPSFVDDGVVLPYWRPNTPIAPPLETFLVVEPPDGAPVQIVPLIDTILIGRGSTADIQIRDISLARLHLRLTWGPDGLTVEDLGSTNGTWSTRRLEPGIHRVHVGERLTCGRNRLSFLHRLPPGPEPDDDMRGLLAAICEAPDDDEPRLVLADLLSTRGDPRGEFIALQIAAEVGVNREAHDRAEALLAEHEFAWLAPLPVRVASWTFRRGFLDCVWVPPGQSVAELRAHHPLRAAVELER